MGEYLDLRGRE